MPKKLFNIPFDGRIWKVVANPERHTLIVEVRKPSHQEVYFFELDLNSQQLTPMAHLEQNWWFGLQESRNDMVIFQEFNSKQMPASKSIIGYDLKSKKITWKQENLGFHHSNQNYIGALQFVNEISTLIFLDISSGKTIPSPIDVTANITPAFNNPIHYKNDNTYFVSIATFILNSKNHIAVEAIDYLELGQLILISYYICDTENKLTNCLFIIDTEGKVVLSEILGEKLPGIGIDTFWIYNDQLLFIKNKSELNCYSLPLL